MKHSRFVHLHLHTDYSFLDGACRIEPLVEKAVSLKMPALAVTDHGNMCGAIKFYKYCISKGVKPIIGCEFYVAPKSRKDRSKESGSSCHMTLLAKGPEGYLNLMRMNEIAYSEGFYHKPRVDMETIEKHSKGIIALSGCLQGRVATHIREGNSSKALEEAGRLNEIFGKGNFYLEMMDTGVPDQKKVNRELAGITAKTGIECVATNDCHYIEKDDAYAQEILMCIGTGKKIDDPAHLKFSTEEYYLKSEEEMKKLFKEYPEAVENTVKVAEKCNLQIEFDQNLLPEYSVPEKMTKQEYLEKLCLDGIRKRYGKTKKEVKERLDTELAVINRLGFAGYFLICWDFVNFARQNDIPVGPGRGSGAGSIVSYLLGITNLDPLNYGLLFERFLNPDRKTMPDLDIDFADTGRDRVIEYVKEKYGRDRVGQIATFSTLKARAAVRDVGRVLDIPYDTVDKVAKMVPPDNYLCRSIEEVAELKNVYESDDRMKQMLDIASRIEGCKRQPGVHAAGVVIAKDQLSRFVPRGVSADNRYVTQYEGEDLVDLGLLKMDFLGLRSLSIIQMAVDNVKKQKKTDLDLDSMPMDDKKTFRLISNSETLGVFQIESSGFRDMLRKMDVTRFEDIIALVALYRPGVMASGMTEEYIERKNKVKPVVYWDPSLEEILKETYGIVLYQEQVMQVARKLANFSPAQADDMRKAMSKKIPEALQKLQQHFVEGAVKNGLGRKKAEEIFDNLSKFGAYGFNKSHSAAYATLAYQTAYLKTNYPTEYMCALLTCEMGDTDKVAQYVEECRRMGIEVKAPSVQESEADFTIEKEGVIRYGLQAVKNVGSAAIESIIKARSREKFKSFYDFCSRVDMQKVNKRVIESLVKSGAFDWVNAGRRPLFEVIDNAMSQASAFQKDAKAGQTSFFEVIDGGDSPEIEITDRKEWHENELLAFEKDSLGFFFSGHPLGKYAAQMQSLTTASIEAVRNRFSTGAEITIGGLIKHPKKIKTRKGDMMMAFMLEDLSGLIDVVVFPSAYSEETAQVASEDELAVVIGKLDERRGRKQCIADKILPFEEAKTKLVRKIVLRLNSMLTDEAELERLKKIISKFPGEVAVEFEVQTKKYGWVKISTNAKTRISESLLKELNKELGKESISLIGAAQAAQAGS